MSRLESLPGYDQWKTREPHSPENIELPLRACGFDILRGALQKALETDPIRSQVGRGPCLVWIDDLLIQILESYYDIHTIELTPDETAKHVESLQALAADRKRDERNER